MMMSQSSYDVISMHAAYPARIRSDSLCIQSEAFDTASENKAKIGTTGRVKRKYTRKVKSNTRDMSVDVGAQKKSHSRKYSTCTS